VPPLTHGFGSQTLPKFELRSDEIWCLNEVRYVRNSHRWPWNSGGQIHWKTPCGRGSHVPPFVHGFGSHTRPNQIQLNSNIRIHGYYLTFTSIAIETKITFTIESTIILNTLTIRSTWTISAWIRWRKSQIQW